MALGPPGVAPGTNPVQGLPSVGGAVTTPPPIGGSPVPGQIFGLTTNDPSSTLIVLIGTVTILVIGTAFDATAPWAIGILVIMNLIGGIEAVQSGAVAALISQKGGT